MNEIMETSREDFGIAIRSAFLAKGTKQRFSLFAAYSSFDYISFC